MRHTWRLEPQALGHRLSTCWRCGRLAVWDLTWYGCGVHDNCGIGAHEHYCHTCAIARGQEPHGPAFDDDHIRRVRQHPWKLDEEVAA